MSWSSRARSEEGFTIQELMVVMVVGSLLVVFSFSLFIFTGKLFHSWQKNTELHAEVSRVLQLMALDVSRSKQITELTDSTLTLRGGLSTEVRYRSSGGQIWRNGDPVGLPTVQFHARLWAVQSTKDRTFPDGVTIQVNGASGAVVFSGQTMAIILKNAREEFLGTQN